MLAYDANRTIFLTFWRISKCRLSLITAAWWVRLINMWHCGVNPMCFSGSGPTHFLRWIVYYCVCIQHDVDKSQISFIELCKTSRTNSGLRAIIADCGVWTHPHFYTDLCAPDCGIVHLTVISPRIFSYNCRINKWNQNQSSWIFACI